MSTHTQKVTVKPVKERERFRLFFLKNDESEDIEVEEVEKIDFEEIIARLDRGESVFITNKREQKLNDAKESAHE